MKFTDLFVQKPVLAWVVSLFIFLLGVRAVTELNVRQYPELQDAVVTVTTTYIGADADLIQGFITTPLEREIATAEGINYITSSSTGGVSLIQAFLRLDANQNAALTQIVAKVNKMRGELPAEAEDPVVDMTVGDTTAAMYLAFYSEILDNNQTTDYLVRVVEPLLSTVPGVQRAEILGARTFAMRIWLDPARMTALGVTASDVYGALQSNNVLSAVGSTKGSLISIDLTAETDLQSVAEFEELIVRESDGAITRLRDVANVELGAESYGTSVSFGDQAATFMGIEVAPDANSLDVIKAVREVWDNDILPELPEGLSADIPYDSTEYIQDSINEVVKTIVEALLIVIVVIFLFLGSLRSVLVPMIAVPISMVGALFLMLLMGFSINLLTLLAMVLAIGIVVDDAIIVLENIHRHVEEGMAPYDAAIKGARELAWPVVAMTTTLVAVYLPIGFIGGLTGTLFVEFAFTLAGSVLLSGIVALTLSPMLCAKLLKPHTENSNDGLAHWLDTKFESLRLSYRNTLHGTLNTKFVVLIFGTVALVSCYFLFINTPEELAPGEDQGFILAFSESDPYTTMEYFEANTALLREKVEALPEMDKVFMINGMSAAGAGTVTDGITGMVLKTWEDRDRSTRAVLEQSVQLIAPQIPGLEIAAFQPPPLPSGGGGGFPVEFVIGTTQPISTTGELIEQIVGKAYESRKFIFLKTDLRLNKPRTEIVIDREKAAALGIDMRSVGQDLSAMLAGGYSNRFSLENRSYKVIPQVQRSDRLNTDQLLDYYTRTRDGNLVPLSTIATLKDTVQPQALKRFQQMNAVTISAVPRPGVSLGEALTVLEQAAAEVLPAQGYRLDYSGQSRQFKTEGSQLLMTFFFAMVIIYLVLSAQFESWRDPLIMLVSVPMSICGALLCMAILNIASSFAQFGGLLWHTATMNIYTQVGLVTLIGVISKHGILIVEFANKLQDQGLSKRAAIEEATSIRLRPVLMTTAALVLAMIPLLIAAGPGAGARFAMGFVIATGMTLGTLFTLFVVPAIYLYIGRDHGNTGESMEHITAH
ncbi:RND transporter, hydrophobe/amphiphile efflux-1 (HAE1) family protein [Isoalcanivorax pacificus W11-5]|uniref:RND transporter, hydrophobe/amphiphile efflux-1 (HAE1) family protein n=1 Tax=Isoalcanivorax pacificus W11-5 TaxID=391936 RepID=A0A0B4XU38_9GAMM|nr:efflux RND transporter permease subunit [Isoalcanivorax pacificus]AJD49983.1 RND transporter, hydrophobe/amphiphile efflux-1 (HAE1) family protein [Isoalcanivorax pacificus W11-5]